jgi:fructose-specific component phosphotransferase system IIB-like protein
MTIGVFLQICVDLRYSKACVVRQFHLHCESESSPQVLTVGMDVNITATILENFLANVQAHTEPFFVDVYSAGQLAKGFEELFLIFWFNAFARVDDSDNEHLCLVVVGRLHYDGAFVRKFKCVFHQVDQHLLKPDLVTQQLVRHGHAYVFEGDSCLLHFRLGGEHIHDE